MAPLALSDVVEAYRRRLRKQVDDRLLTDDDASSSMNLLQSITWEPAFSHGDLLLSNCMAGADGLVIIDWEFAGYDVPGRDEAQLRTLLVNEPGKRRAIREAIAREGSAQEALFELHLNSVLAQEIPILRESRIETFVHLAVQLEADLDRVRSWLRTGGEPSWCP